MTDVPEAEALDLASSPDWEKRCAAVPVLVRQLDQPQVREALLALLLDADTAVTDEAAHALLLDGSPAALGIFARGWLVADEDDTLPQMTDHLYDWAGADPWPYDWPSIVRNLKQLADTEDEELSNAARTLLADLPTHRLEATAASTAAGSGDAEGAGRHPLSGRLTVEWMDAADPEDSTVPPNFGWFSCESDPPLDAPRLLVLLRDLAGALEEEISNVKDPWLGSRAPKSG